MHKTAHEFSDCLVGLVFLFFFFYKQKSAFEVSPCLVDSGMCVRDQVGVLNALSMILLADTYLTLPLTTIVYV